MAIKNITLMGIEFEVHFEDEILEDGERKAGHLDAQAGVIQIQKDMIPAAQKTHLLTHALWFGVSGIAGAVPVETAQALAIHMYDTLRRNPDMVKWLMADDR
jgi:hypothetical protein